MPLLLERAEPAEFGPSEASHLMWRAGFGCTWEEAEALAKGGMESAVNALVASDSQDPLPPAPDFAVLPEQTDRDFEASLNSLSSEERNLARNARRDQEWTGIRSLQHWWLGRMRTASNPLTEKMTLFWHSHFASSFEDKIERVYPLWVQNQFLRENALSSFPVLLRGIIRDPAMLVWLDNANSHKDRPNENFARELMELFSTGVNQYTEEDVKGSARALTGHSVDTDTWQFRFREDAHDTDIKAFMKWKGTLAGDDIVRILCEQPSTARFITGKLLEHFLYENPEEELLDEAVGLFTRYTLSVRTFLATLFKSRVFYAAGTRGRIVKDPVTLALGALKVMREEIPEGSLLPDALRVMGQDLFFPPDVNGWPGGMTWINSNTLLVRYNFSNFLMHGVSPDQFKVFDRAEMGTASARREFVQEQRSPDAIEWDPKQQLLDSGAARGLTSPERIAAHYVKEFLQRNVPAETMENLVRFCKIDAAGGSSELKLNDSRFNERIKGLVHLIMSSPEYQLC